MNYAHFCKRKFAIEIIFTMGLLLLSLTLTSCNQATNGQSIFNQCFDANNDHCCDLCGRVINTCVDIDNDHFCDMCSANISICPIDAIQDHLCDVCGKKIGSCFDSDNTHICDHCGLPMMDCEDKDFDHL